MELKIQDIAELLEISEREVQKMIKGNKIPYHKIGPQYRFNKAEISDWVVINNIHVSDKILNLNISKLPAFVGELLRKGGIYKEIPGDSMNEIILNVIQLLNLPENTNRTELATAILQREELMHTAIGRGIAIPHPRNPIMSEVEDESIALCRLAKPLDYNALDGKSIHSLFILLSTTPKRHLEMLSKLSFLCQQDEFISLLEQKADSETLLAYIDSREKESKELHRNKENSKNGL